MWLSWPMITSVFGGRLSNSRMLIKPAGRITSVCCLCSTTWTRCAGLSIWQCGSLWRVWQVYRITDYSIKASGTMHGILGCNSLDLSLMLGHPRRWNKQQHEAPSRLLLPRLNLDTAEYIIDTQKCHRFLGPSKYIRPRLRVPMAPS